MPGSEKALCRLFSHKNGPNLHGFDSRRAHHDEPALLEASRFKAEKRIPLADALIAGLASRLSAVLVHKDSEFEALNGVLDLEALPYKSET